MRTCTQFGSMCENNHQLPRRTQQFVGKAECNTMINLRAGRKQRFCLFVLGTNGGMFGELIMLHTA